MDDRSPDLNDMLMANGFMLEVFMLQMALELARTKDNPEAWARSFVSTLHERVDSNEIRMDDRRYPTHELARAGFDRLGNTLNDILELDRRSPQP